MNRTLTELVDKECIAFIFTTHDNINVDNSSVQRWIE